MINAIVLGGGTGSYTILSSLKNYVPNLTAIVNMTDDGGSTGVLRDELGVLPPGDLRQCLIALSKSPELIRSLLNYRFESGTLKGHAFGNILLSALEKTTGSMQNAADIIGQLFNLSGRVLPVTLDNSQLCLKYTKSNGSTATIMGENNIASTNVQNLKNAEFLLTPPAEMNPDIENLLEEADLIIFAPGDFWASIVPLLLVGGLTKALKKSPARKILINNLVTKPGQTHGFFVHDFVDSLEKYLGKNFFDYVIYNNTVPPEKILAKYLADQEELVKFNTEIMQKKKYQAIGDDLVDDSPVLISKADVLLNRSRNLIRHNSDRVARIIMQIYFNNN